MLVALMWFSAAQALAAADESACVDCVDPALLALVPPDMQYRRAPIADAANGFLALQRAAEMVGDAELPPGVGCSSQPLAENERAAIDDWLTANEAALARVEEALRAPAFQLPLFDLSLRWSPVRRATKLKVARARLACGGRTVGRCRGRSARHLCPRAAHARRRSGAAHLPHRRAVQSDALRGMRCLAAEPGVPVAILTRISTAVAAAPDLCDGYAHALRVELNTWLLPRLMDTAGAGDAAQLAQRTVDDSACTPKRRCRAVLTRLLAAHAAPFDAADTVRVAGDSMTRLASACREAVEGADLGASKDYPAPLDGILAALLEGGRLRVSRRDVDTAVAQFVASPNPLGRLAARPTSFAYFPTSRRTERATTLMILAARRYGDLTADEAVQR